MAAEEKKAESSASAGTAATATTTKDEAAATSTQPLPPVEAAARRLERLLGGGKKAEPTTFSSAVSNAEAVLHSNPSKIVKRWLGTSSGTAAAATLPDLSGAAVTLLDPTGPCATGRDLILNLSPPPPPPAPKVTGGESAMDVDGAAAGEEKKDDGDAVGNKKKDEGPAYLAAAAREVEGWLLTLAVRLLWRDGRQSDAFGLAGKGINVLQAHVDDAGSRVAGAGAGGSAVVGGAASLYPLLARMQRYRSLSVEGLGGDAVSGVRPSVVHSHRMACLRRDVDNQATLLNLMLRDLLNADQVEQAQKLLSNSTFPDSASNNQLCRYLYHSGRIQALRLEYTSAFSNLSQCLRKAPTNTGLGFRIAAQRLLVVVQLLMGEIPERTVFFTEGMKAELAPYMKITQAVRRGDLAVFHETVSQHAARLREDGTYTLISRLAHSVVKAGLRKLKVSYSRISLDDVAHRLGLPCATSAEFVIAKAVRDGVIDATIDHEAGCVQSHDLLDVYATTEPAEAFHRRIAYCLTTHNDAVRGMRYPPDAYKKQLEASRGLRGRGKDDDKTDEEKAAELEDEMDEDY